MLQLAVFDSEKLFWIGWAFFKWSGYVGFLSTLSMSGTRPWNENPLKRSWKQNLLYRLLVRAQRPHATSLQTQSSRAMPQSPRTTKHLNLQTWTVWLVLLRSSLLHRIWGLSLSPNPGFYTFPKVFILFQQDFILLCKFFILSWYFVSLPSAPKYKKLA